MTKFFHPRNYNYSYLPRAVKTSIDTSLDYMYSMHMPVIMTINSVKFCIYFDDHGKAHCHVIKNECEAKILIESGECIEVSGFSKKDVNHLEKLVKKNAKRLLKAWEECNE